MGITLSIRSLLKNSVKRSAHLLRKTRNKLRFRSNDVIIRSDGAGWILDQFAGALFRNLKDNFRIGIATEPIPGVKNRIIHFINRECFTKPQWSRLYDSSNKMIGLWWHGGPDSVNPKLRKIAKDVKLNSKLLTKVHVTCSISRDLIRELGVPENKIVFIPMGVDLKQFHPPSGDSERMSVRRQFGIPKKRFVVGLFQKDGVGWGDGSKPKLVKGPDIFIQVMTRLSKSFPIFVLIPGPARGYVIQGLEELGIPYRNDGHVPHNKMALYYHACDVCMIPGREEGGPAALLEAIATGIPIVANRVGMAPDMIIDGKNGYLVNIGDIDEFVQKTAYLLENKSLWQEFSNEGLKTIQTYDWPVVAKDYGKFYASLL